jgi:hypothetical protein
MTCRRLFVWFRLRRLYLIAHCLSVRDSSKGLGFDLDIMDSLYTRDLLYENVMHGDCY